jgi:hypothetical protein
MNPRQSLSRAPLASADAPFATTRPALAGGARLNGVACFILMALMVPVVAQAPKPTPGNRLTYLDELDPYYPHAKFPKLITPQWVGEEGVEAVVVLAIDDMRDPARYETYLRPILRRLKQIDGRAPVSIMTCSVKPDDPQLQTWLKEGLSIECHTIDHPGPFFKIGFEKAKSTYDRCVDLMNEIPGNKPVAYRMPCCDSLNTPSPRHWAEIFNKTTDKGNFLSIDSSVFMYYTSDDPELPKNLVLDADGNERFKRYLPKDRSFVNTIENYPYPYVIGNLCWQFPCMTPSDWQAQHLQKPNNPKTLEDWKAALDCTVIKQGVFNMVFHPHGWIRNDQVVEFIDHAVAKHGKKVKFLTFKEARERLDKNLLRGMALRNESGERSLRHLADRNGDGYLDIVSQTFKEEWHWVPRKSGGNWKTVPPTSLATLQPATWEPSKPKGPYRTELVDIERNGNALMIFEAEQGSEIYRSLRERNVLQRLPFGLPPGARVYQTPFDSDWKRAGLRFLDLNADGKLDIIFSNEKEYGIYLFTDMEKGWSKKVLAGKRGENKSEPRASASGAPSAAGELPMISRHGTNNGFWVHSGHLWWSNEDTALLKDHVDRRNIKELLKDAPK